MEKETKRCPACGEEILAVAKKCKHCGEWLEGDNQSVVNNENLQNEDISKRSFYSYLTLGVIEGLWGLLWLLVCFFLLLKFMDVTPAVLSIILSLVVVAYCATNLVLDYKRSQGRLKFSLSLFSSVIAAGVWSPLMLIKTPHYYGIWENPSYGLISLFISLLFAGYIYWRSNNCKDIKDTFFIFKAVVTGMFLPTIATIILCFM